MFEITHLDMDQMLNSKMASIVCVLILNHSITKLIEWAVDNSSIIIITETHCSKAGLINLSNYHKPFETVRNKNSKGGILIAANTDLNEPMLIEVDENNASFLNVQINIYSTELRIIACYAPQDNASLEIKTAFFRY